MRCSAPGECRVTAGGEFAATGLTPKVGNAVMAVEAVTDERMEPRICNQAIRAFGIEARVALGGDGFPSSARTLDRRPRWWWRIGQA